MEAATVPPPKRKLKCRKQIEDDHQDLTSALPVHLLQHILSFVPTIDAVRCSTLSSAWLHAWKSIPVSNFNFACDTNQLEATFPLVANFYNSISILNEKESMAVKNLRVSWPSFRNDYYQSCIDEWMGIVSRHRVREIEIDVDDGGPWDTYLLHHETLFAAADSLVVLKLKGCRMRLHSLRIESRNFVSLRVLYWEYYFVKHDVVQELLPLCPNLEECTIISSSQSVYSKILLTDHRKLKHLKIDGFMVVTIKGMSNLQVLDVLDFWSIDCGNSCDKVRKLRLTTAKQNNYGYLQYLISNCPLLKSLVLETNYEVTISNHIVENISFCSYMSQQNILVHAPRLRCYEYRGTLLPEISFGMNPIVLKRIDLVLTPGRDETNFFNCLKRNLPKLAAYNSVLKLTINAKNCFPDKLPPKEGHPLSFIDFVELQNICSTLIQSMSLIKWLFWCSRPLRLSTSPSNTFLQVFQEIILQRLDDAKLCRDYGTCACYHLRAVKVETRCGIRDFKNIKIDEDSELLSEDTLMFQLEWL